MILSISKRLRILVATYFKPLSLHLFCRLSEALVVCLAPIDTIIISADTKNCRIKLVVSEQRAL